MPKVKCSEKPSQVKRYKRTPGRANMSGELYEINLSALLFIRCLIQGYKFKIATNMKAAGSFDDIVLSIGDVPVFIQVKHRLNESKTIFDNQFTQLKGDFALLKYCETFFSMKMHWCEDLARCGIFEKSIFVFYTNAKVACSNQPKAKQKKNNRMAKEQRICTNSDSKWQNLLDTGGNYCSIERHSEFYKPFENFLEYKRILKERKNPEKLLEAVQALKDKDATEVPSQKELDDLEKSLEKLKGVGCYEEFLSRVWIFSDQANEQTLRSWIESEIKRLLHVSDSKMLTEKLLARFQEWWRSENFFLEENSILWQDILKPRWEFLSSEMMTRLIKLTDIKFGQQEIKRFRKELSKYTSIIHIVAPYAPILTCLKAFRCFEGMHFIIINRKTDKQHHKEILSYSKHHIVLILFGEYVDFADFLNSPQLKEGNWRVLLISKSEDNYDTILDTCNLPQLHESSRTTILSKCVCFQGKQLQLKSITFRNANILSAISGETILDILNDSNILSIGNPHTEEVKHYIDRTLQRKDNISKDILKIDAIFAISGTDTLHQLIPKGEKVLKYVPGQKAEQLCRIYEITHELDFEELSRTFKKIHWLQQNGERFQWVQSKGDIETIRNHLDLEQTTSSWNKIAYSSERLIVVIAEPGMGKSTLMSHIAKEMKRIHLTRWVIKISLSDHAEYFSEINPSPLGLLERGLNIKDHFQKCLLKLSLEEVGNIAVLLDGFDEISPYYDDQVIGIIQKLLDDTKVKQIWVTSRQVMKEKLEKKLCNLSYALKPFSKADKKKIICKCWNVCGSKMFPTELLNFTSLRLNDQSGEFTGIPSQLMMLAEILRTDILHIKESELKDFLMALDISELYGQLIDKTLDIYFKKKQKKNIYNAGNMAERDTIIGVFRKKHMMCAIFSILPKEVFSNIRSSKKIEKNINKFLANVQDGKEKTGIIVSVNDGKPTFIHRSYAEYFTAMWLVKSYREHPELVVDVWFSSAFETTRLFFDRYVTRGCILHVAVLNENKQSVRDIVISNRSLHKNLDECGRTALHLAVISYGNQSTDEHVQQSRLEILQTILTFQKESLADYDNLLGWRPLKYADKMYAWPIINLFLQEGADEKDMEFTYNQLDNLMFLTTFVKQSIMKGYSKIVEYIIRHKPEVVNAAYFVNKPDIFKYAYIQLTMLHAASLEGHGEIVELLIKCGSKLEARDNIFGETPLLWAAKLSHWHIVDMLIDKRADITAKSRERDARVVRLSEDYSNHKLDYFNDQELNVMQNNHTNNELINSELCERLNDQEWLHIRNTEKGNTLLHYAAKSADNDTLCRLLKYPTILDQVNSENRNALSPIECAARARKWESVKTLSNHGAVCTPIVVYHGVASGRVDVMEHVLKIPEVLEVPVGSMPLKYFLLMLAANSKQWDMLTFLIKLGLSLPAYSGTTVLHLAVKSKNRTLLDFVLDQTGVDVDVLNGEQETAFMCAARDGNLYALENLLKRGANPLLEHPTGGYTALNLAGECEDHSVVTFLLKLIHI